MKIRVGILGYGNLGRYLCSKILADESFQLVFVWNRTRAAIKDEIDPKLVLEDINELVERDVDIIVEVSHPSMTIEYGDIILNHSNYLIGSPSVLAEPGIEKKLKMISATTKHAVFIPSGALWGGEDIRKMADAGTLKSLRVSVKKHPRSLKLSGELAVKNSGAIQEPVVLYEGAIRELCLQAPQNTNFMAVAAIAAHNLGFDKVIGCLIADPSLAGWHAIGIDAEGYPTGDGTCFSCNTVRKNPSAFGAVTGSATYESFFQSLRSTTVTETIKANSGGFHLC